MEVALLARRQGLGFVDAVEDVGLVPELGGLLRGVDVVGAGQDAFGGGAAALEDQGEIVEGEGLAADAGVDRDPVGELEGVVEADEDLKC